MNLDDLYSTSPALIAAVRDAEARLAAGVETPIQLVEVITLPDYGQRVILRFRVPEGHSLPVGEADSLESRLRDLAGPNFWATVVASDAAPDYDMGERLIEIDRALPDTVLLFPDTAHSELVRQDAHVVREALGLSEEHLIWEIEVPMSDGTAPLVFRIVDTGETGAGLTSRHESGPIEIDGVVCEAVYLRSNPSFQGCLKAYLAAKERPVALANFIAGYPEAPTPSA